MIDVIRLKRWKELGEINVDMHWIGRRTGPGAGKVGIERAWSRITLCVGGIGRKLDEMV